MNNWTAICADVAALGILGARNFCCHRARACVAIFALALAGCATFQSPDQDPSISCMEKVDALPTLAPLKVKLGSLRGTSMDLDVLADKSKPTPEEKTLIKQWHSARLSCMSEGDKFRASKTIPGYFDLVSDHTNSIARLTSRLVQEELSYSEFAAERSQIYQTLNDRVQRLYQNFAVNEAQANQRAAMTYLMLQGAMPKPQVLAPTYQVVQPIPVVPQPVYVPPRTINCTSSTYALTTHTTCR